MSYNTILVTTKMCTDEAASSRGGYNNSLHNHTLTSRYRCSAFSDRVNVFKVKLEIVD